MIEDRRSPTIALLDDAIRILKESEIIGIERNNPPDSNVRELWPIPADVLVVLLEHIKPLAWLYDSQPTRDPILDEAGRVPDDQRRIYDVVITASALAAALDLAATDGVKPRANRRPTAAEIAAYWARYDACLVCRAAAQHVCYDLRSPVGDSARPAHAPHRGRTLLPSYGRRRGPATPTRETQ